jgi:hypothetical protein
VDAKTVRLEVGHEADTSACSLAGCARLAAADNRLADSKRKALSSADANRALIAPRQAIDRGFKGAVPMKNDANLEPSRSRADSPKLLAEVVAKAKP